VFHGWPLWNICVTNDHGYVPLVVNTCRFFPHLWLITRFVTRLTWRMPLVKHELFTLPEYLNSPRVFSEVRVTRSLALCVSFEDRCFSLCTFSFGHCVVCSSSIYEFWLPLWYLQTLLFHKRTQKYYAAITCPCVRLFPSKQFPILIWKKYASSNCVWCLTSLSTTFHHQVCN